MKAKNLENQKNVSDGVWQIAQQAEIKTWKHVMLRTDCILQQFRRNTEMARFIEKKCGPSFFEKERKALHHQRLRQYRQYHFVMKRQFLIIEE